jgi:hypothetical protein
MVNVNKQYNLFARSRFLVRSNFGRASGWTVELDGYCVGELTECQWVDMFWDSYAVTPVGDVDPPPILDDKYWSESKFVFRNRESGAIVTYAFCGGSPPYVKNGRVLMRRLYLVPTNRLESLCISLLRIVQSARRRQK